MVRVLNPNCNNKMLDTSFTREEYKREPRLKNTSFPSQRFPRTTKNKGMGAAFSVLGKINEESPSFSLLKKTAEYEIRKYAKSTAIETTYEAVRDFFYE